MGIKLLLDDHMGFNKTVHQLIRLIWCKLALEQFAHVLVVGNVAPSSSDCNLLDYYVWGVLERESNKRAHNSVVLLKASIVDAVASMNREHLVSACKIQQARSQQRYLAEGLHCGGSDKHEQGAPCQHLQEDLVLAGGGHRG
ncbi:Uncharacterized protein FKW44_019797 [Caligus rogercresseyi]|uniref:Uncharacterized protein n=1 Tax=Caligus rogercresseyi TaxID=217165 RepID=A0A7T8GWC0_CALRO|nr:Uncharacterized protein FKW44_019797 [Caligus rogercresseyi]